MIYTVICIKYQYHKPYGWFFEFLLILVLPIVLQFMLLLDIFVLNTIILEIIWLLYTCCYPNPQ